MANIIEEIINGMFSKDMNNPIVNDIPEWLQYFTQNAMNNSTWQKMSNLEGWGHNVRSPDWNYPLAYLTNSQPSIQWGDVGPAGARWHGASMTPSGAEWLKAPWHPTHHYEDEMVLREALNRVLNGR